MSSKQLRQPQTTQQSVPFSARRTGPGNHPNTNNSRNDKTLYNLHGNPLAQGSGEFTGIQGLPQLWVPGPCVIPSGHTARRACNRARQNRLRYAVQEQAKRDRIYTQIRLSQHSPNASRSVTKRLGRAGPNPFLNCSRERSISVAFHDKKPRCARKGNSGLEPRPQSPISFPNTPGTSAASSERSGSSSGSSVPTSPGGEDQSVDLETAEVEALLQPQTRPITLNQLVVEIRTIYEVVIQFEDKAIRINEDHAQRPKTKEDYMSYIAIHKTLLHEHHDLCLAAQHPAASENLRQMPARYSIPARMWRHGVHAPLETLRTLLPDSREHMVAFILISFNHMTLFLETVPQFEATWLECIGDLGRYRLALAETDEERETFSGIAQYWYSRTVRLNPRISRLYHHCAILAPSFSLEQLSLYGRALTGMSPFLPARKSISALFHPVLSNDEQLARQDVPGGLTFIRAHAALAIGGPGSRAEFERSVNRLSNGPFFRNIFQQPPDAAKKAGIHIAIASLAGMLQYGATSTSGSSASILRLAMGMGSHGSADLEDSKATGAKTVSAATALECLTPDELTASVHTFRAGCSLSFTLLLEALQNPKEENLHPLIHIFFVIIWSSVSLEGPAQEIIEDMAPWAQMVGFLNAYSNAASMSVSTCSPEFPEDAQPLQEDHLLLALVISRGYLDPHWMDESGLDLTEQGMELHYMTAARLQRILWLGHSIAKMQKWLLFDDKTRQFRVIFKPKRKVPEKDEDDFVPLLLESVAAR